MQVEKAGRGFHITSTSFYSRYQAQGVWIKSAQVKKGGEKSVSGVLCEFHAANDKARDEFPPLTRIGLILFSSLNYSHARMRNFLPDTLGLFAFSGKSFHVLFRSDLALITGC
jgi:hypothetical protein